MAMAMATATHFHSDARSVGDNARHPVNARIAMNIVRTAAVLVVATLLLGGCGLFGCAGWATNGAGFGGCSVGTRF
ncbi:hypothetical protein AWB72_02362 [Caballeronia concitans]|uniref:Uncharacterized protein n=2 Tax=Caballeronia concitans TaxID=1777133 RepID=A0A658QWG6_9BURK|nr:hypothetical protein BurMR1_0640 [Burkholderia sp. MR1]SAL28834.1 hypothetical protein AWB72_02362 [Caballeronia concitans]